MGDGSLNQQNKEDRMAEEKKKHQKTKERKLDPKWIEGLVFRSSEVKEIEEDGRKVKRYTPTERPMKPSDVVSWKDYGDHVVLVTADGQKVRVKK